jgi:alanine dehydrogenase
MIIGVPKEIKKDENRVSLTPAGARELSGAGHQVLVEQGAGVGSSISDDDYVANGATIIKDADDVWADSELVLKVKEPVARSTTVFRLARTRCCSRTCIWLRRVSAPTPW